MKTKKQIHRTNTPDHGLYVVGKYDKFLRRKAVRKQSKRVLNEELEQL